MVIYIISFSLRVYHIKHCREYCRYKNGEIFTFNNHIPQKLHQNWGITDKRNLSFLYHPLLDLPFSFFETCKVSFPPLLFTLSYFTDNIHALPLSPSHIDSLFLFLSFKNTISTKNSFPLLILEARHEYKAFSYSISLVQPFIAFCLDVQSFSPPYN